jgi:hypothetical protein
MLELIVLRHESRQLECESLDHTGVLHDFHEGHCVFLQLLWLEFLVNVEVLNTVFKCLNYL